MNAFNGLPVIGAFGRGISTVAFGTRIRSMTQAMRTAYTYLTHAAYTAGGTAHTVTFMRGQSYTTARLAAAAAAVTVYVNDALVDGGGAALAAADLVALELTDSRGKKVWHMGIVDTSGWDATAKSILLTSGTALPTGLSLLAGDAVIAYGVAGDTDHLVHTRTGAASATTNFPAVANAGPVIRSRRKNEPIIVDSNNATATGSIDCLSAVFALGLEY